MGCGGRGQVLENTWERKRGWVRRVGCCLHAQAWLQQASACRVPPRPALSWGPAAGPQGVPRAPFCPHCPTACLEEVSWVRVAQAMRWQPVRGAWSKAFPPPQCPCATYKAASTCPQRRAWGFLKQPPVQLPSHHTRLSCTCPAPQFPQLWLCPAPIPFPPNPPSREASRGASNSSKQRAGEERQPARLVAVETKPMISGAGRLPPVFQTPPVRGSCGGRTTGAPSLC